MMVGDGSNASEATGVRADPFLIRAALTGPRRSPIWTTYVVLLVVLSTLMLVRNARLERGFERLERRAIVAAEKHLASIEAELDPLGQSPPNPEELESARLELARAKARAAQVVPMPDLWIPFGTLGLVGSLFALFELGTWFPREVSSSAVTLRVGRRRFPVVDIVDIEVSEGGWSIGMVDGQRHRFGPFSKPEQVAELVERLRALLLNRVERDAETRAQATVAADYRSRVASWVDR